jgi:hypothetical protein
VSVKDTITESLEAAEEENRAVEGEIEQMAYLAKLGRLYAQASSHDSTNNSQLTELFESVVQDARPIITTVSTTATESATGSGKSSQLSGKSIKGNEDSDVVMSGIEHSLYLKKKKAQQAATTTSGRLLGDGDGDGDDNWMSRALC